MAIQSPSFQQQDWIAALPAVARNDGEEFKLLALPHRGQLDQKRPHLVDAKPFF